MAWITNILLKGEVLNQKSKSFPKIVKLGDVVSKLMQLKRITDEGLGAKLQLLGNFLLIFWKKQLF